MSAPFDGELFTFTNADGSEIQLRGWGNQFHAVFEDLNGYLVSYSDDTGNYHYATLSEDKQRLIRTDEVVGQDGPGALEVGPHLRPKREAVRRELAAAADPSEDTRRWVERRRERRQELAAIAATAGEGARPAPPTRTTTGTYVGLCILIDFPDTPGTVPQAEVERFCNRVGYSGYGNNGSVRDYFNDVSDGRLTYTNTVTAYYTAQHNKSYYDDPTKSAGNQGRALITEALDHLVSTGFDFSGLTTDGSGYIYALNALYAGTRNGPWSKGLWPHQWGLSTPYNVGGGKRFNDYQITDIGSQLTLRTFCHENGHMICDFPDLYDYGGESNGPGNFCLMGYGANNRNPCEVGAYLKNAAGWASSLEYIEAGTTGAVTAGSNDFFIYHKNATEYFIVENRQRSGRDASLPDDGVAIWHIDELGSNNNEQGTPAQHYECALEQADGSFDLENKSN